MGINPGRIGLLGILTRMGAAIEVIETAAAGREPVATLVARSGPLQATRVTGGEVPLAIDELPLVALAGCFADGETVVSGAEELRHKESDRIATVVDGLRALGAEIEATEDGFAVTGHGRAARRRARRGGRPPAGDARRDRRARLAGRRRGPRAWRRPGSATPGSRPTCATLSGLTGLDGCPSPGQGESTSSSRASSVAATSWRSAGSKTASRPGPPATVSPPGSETSTVPEITTSQARSWT